MAVQKLKHGLLAAAIVLGSGAALANDLSELGKSLTPVGAEKKGNAAGTIPEWTGGLVTVPKGFDPAKGYINPFADEKPLFTISAANMAQYAANLTPGQMEMMKRYPTYKINVYKT
ncbi:MAG: DUF1329 domain-containing protein, partial [Limnobacter sp.]